MNERVFSHMEPKFIKNLVPGFERGKYCIPSNQNPGPQEIFNPFSPEYLGLRQLLKSNTPEPGSYHHQHALPGSLYTREKVVNPSLVSAPDTNLADTSVKMPLKCPPIVSATF
jgi:hypothetical protein